MKTKILRTFSVLVVILVFSTICGYGQETEKAQNLMSPKEVQLRNMYMESDEFQAHYRHDPEDAMAMLDKIVEDLLPAFDNPVSITPLAGETDHAYVTTSLIRQSKDNNCSVANALMAIKGMGKYSSVAGSSANAKQATLESQLIEGLGASGAKVYDVRQLLNRYTGNRYNYNYYQGLSVSSSTFRSYIYNSLVFDRAPLLHAWTEKLKYYNGHETGHYLTVTDMNYNTKKITVYDSNRNDKYYGKHGISFEEAFAIVQKDNVGAPRYFICYWP